MGVEQDWGSGFPSDDLAASPTDPADGLPGGWRTRIERLEQATFEGGPANGTTAVVPSRSWPLW